MRLEHHRPLSAHDEARMFCRIERGDARAKEELIERNLRLVRSVASGYRGLGVPLDDLVQEGVVGLVRAVDKFDRRRGLKFSTYAVWWIRRAVVDALGSSRTIRMPAQAARQLAAVRQAENELQRLSSHTATAEAIAERTGLSPRQVRTLRNGARVPASLDSQIGEDGAPLGSLIADPRAADPWRRLDDLETRRRVWSMLRALPKRHRYVLVRRYGLAGEAQAHGSIGASLGVGEERSRQLEHEALHRLRELGGLEPLAA